VGLPEDDGDDRRDPREDSDRREKRIEGFSIRFRDRGEGGTGWGEVAFPAFNEGGKDSRGTDLRGDKGVGGGLSEDLGNSIEPFLLSPGGEGRDT
jgi:hypothetical protein